MFSNIIFKSVLKPQLNLNYKLVLKTRQLFGQSLPLRPLSDCLNSSSDTNINSNGTTSDVKPKDIEYDVSFVSSNATNSSLDLDSNRKQTNDLSAFRRIDALSEQIDYELLDEISPTIGHSFNLAAFADKSRTIQQLIKLGVNLAEIEKKSINSAEFLLKLDFDADIKPYIIFLVDNGVRPPDLGYFVTKNPYIFGQHMDDLSVRINYLQSKRFNRQMIGSILTKAPKFLNQSTKSIDYKLASIQKDFQLTANELRLAVTTYPRIALLEDLFFKECLFMFKEEFGFNAIEIKEMFLKAPDLFHKLIANDKAHRIAVKVFDLVHNEMHISHELITKFPLILNRHRALIDSRHQYLQTLGRAQYDPKQPNYVPLSAFYELEDNEFCDKYAKTTVQDFNRFSKTL